MAQAMDLLHRLMEEPVKRKSLIKWSVVALILLIGFIAHAIWASEMELKDDQFLSGSSIITLQVNEQQLGENKIHRVYYNEGLQRYSVVVKRHNSDMEGVFEESSKIEFFLDGKDATDENSLRLHDTFFGSYLIFYLKNYPKAEKLELRLGEDVVVCTFPTQTREHP